MLACLSTAAGYFIIVDVYSSLEGIVGATPMPAHVSWAVLG
jgi:hypothetical protein